MSSKNQLDVVLVNPQSRTQVYQSLGHTLAAIEPPVWAGVMATFLRKKGFSVAILDSAAADHSPEDTAQQIAEMDPLVTAVVVYGHQPSASTQSMSCASAICTAIKQGGTKTHVNLLGGHVAALPHRTLQEEDVDSVCDGEGPYTILGLLQALKGGRSEDLKKVRGLMHYEGDQIQVNSPAPLVKELDEEMPELAWDLLPMQNYRAHNWHCFDGLQRQPYASLYTTLGCPYHCTFCCIQAPFKSGESALGLKQKVNSYRFWRPQTIIAQIDKLVNDYGVRNIKISDEMFVLNKRHVEEICDLIIKRGYDLNIWAYARVDTVGDGILDKLKRAGVNWLAFGIEAASERVRDDVQKGFASEDIFNTLQKVRRAGINVIANYIFGLPEDDFDTMQETLDMALDLNCEFANFYCAMAYPGSQLYEIALKEGWPLPKTWNGYSQHAVDTVALPTRHISGAEVLRFRDQAFQTYFHSPRYLDLIARKFGPETREHILEMASHQLVRHYA